MARTRVETRARARVLQALYAWDLRGQNGLERVAAQVWDDLAVPAEERRIAGLLVRTLVASRAAIDAELAEVTTNWRLERLGAVERSVLRLAAAELTRGETPPRVVIQEAVRLAERYGSAQSARFVNGVVDAIARRMGKLEGARGKREAGRGT
jgi:N utilization substance protein B